MEEAERSLSNPLIFEGLKSNFGGVLKELVFNGKFKSLPQDMIQSYLTRLTLLKARMLENNWNYYTKEGMDVPKSQAKGPRIYYLDKDWVGRWKNYGR